MNERQTEESTSTEKTLWDIAEEFEDSNVAFRRVKNLLNFFVEEMEVLICLLAEMNVDYSREFSNKYDRLRSIIIVSEIYLGIAIEDMKLKIDAVYEEDAKSRPRPIKKE